MTDPAPLQQLLALRQKASHEFERYIDDPAHDLLGADYAEYVQQLQKMQVVGVSTDLALKSRNHFARDLLQDIK